MTAIDNAIAEIEDYKATFQHFMETTKCPWDLHNTRVSINNCLEIVKRHRDEEAQQ